MPSELTYDPDQWPTASCPTARHTGAIALRVAVLGMPSSTLGDKAGTGVLDGVLRYAVPGLRDDGSWGVAVVAVGRLTDSC